MKRGARMMTLAGAVLARMIFNDSRCSEAGKQVGGRGHRRSGTGPRTFSLSPALEKLHSAPIRCE